MIHSFVDQRKEEFILSAFLLLAYSAFFSGHFYSIDGLITFQQARSIYEDHSLTFREIIYWGHQFSTSKYGIGLSLTYIPALALFPCLRDYAYHTTKPVDLGRLYLDPLYLTAGAPLHIVFTVLTAYLIGRFCRRLGLGTSGIFWGMLLFGIGSPALVYSRGDFSQPLLSLCWIASFYFAFLYLETSNLKNALMSAIAIGYGILTRFLEGVLILPAIFLLLYQTQKTSRKNKLTAFAVFVLAICIALLITYLVNYQRFGNGLIFGYEEEPGWTTPLWIGVTGLVISPRAGIIWAFPSTFIAPVGIKTLLKKQRMLTYALLFPMISLLLIMGGWWYWWGGWNWGPRLILPILPLLTIFSVEGLSAYRGKDHAFLPWVLLSTGFLWALPGITVDILSGYAKLFDSSMANFDIHAYPPLTAWKFVDHWFANSLLDNTAIDIFWFRIAKRTQGISILVFFLFLACALFVLASFVKNNILIPKHEAEISETNG